MGANKMEMGDTIVSLSLIFVSALQTKKFESSIWWKIFKHSLALVYHRKKKQDFIYKAFVPFPKDTIVDALTLCSLFEYLALLENDI